MSETSRGVQPLAFGGLSELLFLAIGILCPGRGKPATQSAEMVPFSATSVPVCSITVVLILVTDQSDERVSDPGATMMHYPALCCDFSSGSHVDAFSCTSIRSSSYSWSAPDGIFYRCQRVHDNLVHLTLQRSSLL